MRLIPDMTLYLLGVQALLMLFLWPPVTTNDRCCQNYKTAAIVLAVPLATFWLVWGGYSVDAWRYLSGFDKNPYDYLNEQIFWITGHFIAQVVPDPWPLKILSALSILLLSLVYYRYFKPEHTRQLAFAGLLLLATPGFFLLTGNAVRQGLAGSVALLGIVLLWQQRKFRWVLLGLVALLIHKFSFVILLAAAVIRYAPRTVFWLWLLSPLASPMIKWITELAGFNLDQVIAYSAYSEGQYHWAKFAVTSLISTVVALSLWRGNVEQPDCRHLYLLLVALANVLLIYEVPYERLLLFSDFVAPLAISTVVFQYTMIRWQIAGAGVVVAACSWLLWNSHSISLTLGLS